AAPPAAPEPRVAAAPPAAAPAAAPSFIRPQPAPAPAPPPVAAVPPAAGPPSFLRPAQPAPAGPTVDRAATLLFDAGSVALPEGARDELGRIAEQQRATGQNVVVVGYDAPGDPDGASVERANAVANELVRQGVPSASIRVEALTAEAGDADRRRVEIYLD